MNKEIYFFLGAACVPAIHYVMVRLLCLVTLGAINGFKYRRLLTALLSIGAGMGVYTYAALHAAGIAPEIATGMAFAGLIWAVYCAFADVKAARTQNQPEQSAPHRGIGHHSAEY